ncbi:MAG: hypothetical protein JWR61_805 [Ferruginibacter sp.]|uniref:PAS domain-containing protein n=1 Tax=Ferruginibacter sp. TaxID=1940288 RepID=UPI00265A803E|nr:PAS domain-containing protein [Ferruginibacter sp.]MDB5275850.1 hypothetical protein [Ferruginibacter sp.]
MQDLNFDMKAPLLSWDVFCGTYNTLMKDAEKYQQSVQQMKQIAKVNLWSKEQLNEALKSIRQFVIVITDPAQQIAFTGPGFEEMTGYSAEEAYGRNPKFLQGPTTNKKNTQTIKQQLTNNKVSETVLENYRKDGKLYLCKIIIKPVVNIRKQLVNYIAYEQEIAA